MMSFPSSEDRNIKFRKYRELMLFVVKEQKVTRKAVTCDEACEFGHHLHCRVKELTVEPEPVAELTSSRLTNEAQLKAMFSTCGRSDP